MNDIQVKGKGCLLSSSETRHFSKKAIGRGKKGWGLDGWWDAEMWTLTRQVTRDCDRRLIYWTMFLLWVGCCRCHLHCPSENIEEHRRCHWWYRRCHPRWTRLRHHCCPCGKRPPSLLTSRIINILFEIAIRSLAGIVFWIKGIYCCTNLKIRFIELISKWFAWDIETLKFLQFGLIRTHPPLNILYNYVIFLFASLIYYSCPKKTIAEVIWSFIWLDDSTSRWKVIVGLMRVIWLVDEW